jgi:ADP-ribose pyrophosphatase
MNEIKQQYHKVDYELIDRETCYEGFFRLEKMHFKHRRFDGRWSRIVTREIFIRGNATCVLPYDPVEDRVVLLEQFRPGAILENQTPWLLELIAGMNEDGEEPETVARREAIEEANLNLGQMDKICEYLVSPGGTTEKVFLYCAKVNSLEAKGVFGLPEEDEDIKVHSVTLEDAMLMVHSGQINNAAAIIALQWLVINRDELISRWA